MKKIVLVIILFLSFINNTYAYSDTAKSTIVMDIDSNRILYKKNIDEQRLIASITKIMTAVVAIENCDLNSEIEVGEEVLKMYGSNIYLELGEKMTLLNLLYGLLLRSGNDAAIVISNYVGGTEEKFVEMMNKKAKQIGMTNTIYQNSHGLDEKNKNYSTAKDMAILSSYAYKIDVYREISATKKWIVADEKKTYVWNNRNKLLFNYDYATGGKTGYTPSAGRTLVTTANKDNLNLTIVTLNDNDEYTTHKSLYDYFFDKYTNYLIVDKNNFTIDKNIFKDNIYIKKSFSYPLNEEEEKKVKVIVKLQKIKKYKNNEKIGRVVVLLNDNEIFKTEVYVQKKIKKANKIKRIFEFIKNIFT